MTFNSLKDGLTIILITLIAILGLVYWVEYTKAVELSATVEANEVNTCVSILKSKGYLK